MVIMASQTIHWKDKNRGVVVGEGVYVGYLIRASIDEEGDVIEMLIPSDGWCTLAGASGLLSEAKEEANRWLNLIHHPRAIAQANG
jgi:hypothetical protein